MVITRTIIVGVGILAFSFCSTQAQQQISVSETYQKAGYVGKSAVTNYTPSVGQLGAQFGSGVLFGLGSGVIGGVTSIAIFESPTDESAGLSHIGYFAVGSVPYVFGSAYGIYLIANSRTHRASYSDILLGSAIGAGIGGGGILFSRYVLGNRDLEASASIALLTTVVGGIIANMNSIEQRSASTTALINIENNDMSLSSPAIQLTQVGNYNLPNNRGASVKLLNISL